jgi:glycopeptide antibiotics resistance protein
MNFLKYRTNKGRDNNSANNLTIALSVIYLIVLGWILLFKLGVRFSYMQNRAINLVPFSEPLILNGKIDFGEIIMNVLIFVPLGVYAGIIFKKWFFGKILFCFFSVSLIVEGLQFLLRVGAFDITDTITNTLGGVIGLMIFKATGKALKDGAKTQKIINAIAVIGTVVVILFLLLLKTNNLWIKYQ